MQAKKNGGYITYQIIIDIFNDKRVDISMEALDRVYQYLNTEGIKLVDQLSDGRAEDILRKGKKDTIRWYRQRIVVVRRRQQTSTVLSKRVTHNEDLAIRESTLSPEEAVDKLLSREEERPLHSEDLLQIIKTYQLSALEAEELLEYIRQKGVNPPEIDIYQFFRNISQDSFTNCEGVLDDYSFEEDPGWVRSTLCPEKAVDKLLFQAETEMLRGEDVLTVIHECGLCKHEIYQLLEYLWSRGVDLPDGYLPWQINDILEDSRYNGEKGFLTDPHIQRIIKQVKRRNADCN
jgi:hypothetical protein